MNKNEETAYTGSVEAEEETLWLCMGGNAPRREERMLQTVMLSVEDLFELVRRKE